MLLFHQAFNQKQCKYPIGIDISDTKCLYLGCHPHVMDLVQMKNDEMSEGRTRLHISENTICMISNGSYLTLLSQDELGRVALSQIMTLYQIITMLFSANLTRGGAVIGGLLKSCIDPRKATTEKSLEATIKSTGLTTNFIDDCMEALGILKKK